MARHPAAGALPSAGLVRLRSRTASAELTVHGKARSSRCRPVVSRPDRVPRVPAGAPEAGRRRAGAATSPSAPSPRRRRRRRGRRAWRERRRRTGVASVPAAVATVADAAERDIVVTTNLVRAVFSNRGGVLKHWTLLHYADHEGKPADLIPAGLPPTMPRPFSLRLADPPRNAVVNTRAVSHDGRRCDRRAPAAA